MAKPFLPHMLGPNGKSHDIFSNHKPVDDVVVLYDKPFLPHELYSNHKPVNDVVKYAKPLIDALANPTHFLPHKIHLNHKPLDDAEEDMTRKTQMDRSEGLLRDLDAYDNKGPVSKIQLNHAAQFDVQDLMVKHQRFFNDVVVYYQQLRINRWMEEVQVLLDDLKKIPVEGHQIIHKAFNGLTSYDFTTNDFKKGAQISNEEKEDVIEKLEEYEMKMKQMRRQLQLLSKKDKYD